MKNSGRSILNRFVVPATVMLCFLELYRSGILRRKVYRHAGLQRLLNDGRIGEEVTPAMLDVLVEAGVISAHLTTQDFTFLQEFGILRPELKRNPRSPAQPATGVRARDVAAACR